MSQNSLQSAPDCAPTSPRKLKLAFLGGGVESAIGSVHRIAVEMDRRFELVAGCFSLGEEFNRTSAKQYGVDPARTYASFDELLEREARRLDALAILTPTNQHAPQVERCLAAGLPVICEKALVTSREEALAIKEQLGRHGPGILVVIYNYTGYPMLRELKRMVEQGRFGKIEQILIEMPQEGFARFGNDGSPMVPQDWRLHDGAVPTISLDLGVHLHMIVRFLTNERPVAVVATSDSYGNFAQVVDNVSCLARYTNDLSCSIWYSKSALGCRNGLKIRLFGEDGSAEWLQEDPEHLHLADRRGGRFVMDRASPDARESNAPRYTRFKAGHPAGFIEAFANYYCDIADVLQAYRDNGKHPASEFVFGIDEAVEGMAMLEAISRSSAGKCWTELS